MAASCRVTGDDLCDAANWRYIYLAEPPYGGVGLHRALELAWPEMSARLPRHLRNGLLF